MPATLALAETVAVFRASHERMLGFTVSLLRLAGRPDLGDRAVADAAGLAHGYVVGSLAPDTAYEDLSLLPRLRIAAPERRSMFDQLLDEHVQIDDRLATLLPMLAALAEERRVRDTTFREAVRSLAALVLPHIEREERQLMPLCARLSAFDHLALARELATRPPRGCASAAGRGA